MVHPAKDGAATLVVIITLLTADFDTVTFGGS
jgi:hypothetical protein